LIIYSVKGSGIVLNPRNYGEGSCTWRSYLTSKLQQRTNKTKKRDFILNVKSLDREKSVAEKCSSMLDIILLIECSNGKFTALRSRHFLLCGGEYPNLD
jgi:hypothetical protein